MILKNNEALITSDLQRIPESLQLKKRAKTSDTESQIIKKSKQ